MFSTAREDGTRRSLLHEARRGTEEARGTPMWTRGTPMWTVEARGTPMWTVETRGTPMWTVETRGNTTRLGEHPCGASTRPTRAAAEDVFCAKHDEEPKRRPTGNTHVDRRPTRAVALKSHHVDLAEGVDGLRGVLLRRLLGGVDRTVVSLTLGFLKISLVFARLLLDLANSRGKSF